MKKSLIYVSIAALGLLVSGCNDFLDKNPDNRSEINDKTKIDALLTTAYPDHSNVMVLNPRTDIYTDHGVTWEGSQPQPQYDCNFTGFMWEQYTRTESGEDTYEQFWTSSYAAIASANQALASIEKLGDPDELAASKAEGLMCRAYNHFTLLTMYSNMFDTKNASVNPGIPFVEEPENVVIKNYERGTVASTLEKVKKDFLDGIGAIGTAADYKQPKFHFTKDAANAFGARLSLYTNDYASTIGYANALIPTVSAGSLKGVMQNGRPVVNSDGTPALYVDDNDMANLYLSTTMHDWNKLAATPGGVDGVGMAFSGGNAPANLLVSECATLIYRSTFGTAYARHGVSNDEVRRMRSKTSCGSPLLVIGFGLTGDPTMIIPKFYEDFKVEGSSGGQTYGEVYAKIPLLRIEEVLLARAEAYAMTGSYQEALNDLNMWTKVRVNRMDYGYDNNENAIYRDRLIAYYKMELSDSNHFINSQFNADKFTAAGDDLAFQKALILAILDARYVEFHSEGIRYFDILRWNIPVTHVTADGQRSTLTPDDDRRVIQLPQSVSLSGVEPNRWENVGTWH